MNCEKAKQKISIRVVLESFYLFPVKDNNRTAFYFAIDREERTPSLSVEFIKNKAFDFGTGKSYDVISIVQQINQCSVSDALKYLEKFEFSMNNEIHSFEPNKDKTYEILKVIEIQNCALIQYLTSRKVYQQKELVREVHFKIEGKKSILESDFLTTLALLKSEISTLKYVWGKRMLHGSEHKKVNLMKLQSLKVFLIILRIEI